MAGLTRIGYTSRENFTRYKIDWRIFVITIIVFIQQTDAIFITGNTGSHAQFPKWNACVNASISFEFKTTQQEGLLMYVDDGGTYDFIQVRQILGRVEVVLNIVDGQDGHVKIIPQVSNARDGQWHRVEIRRKRMETIVIVDDAQSSRFSFGSDFHFGSMDTNSYVYFGGMPPYFTSHLRELALPSVVFERPFKGAIRNVLYSNCSCEHTRADMMGGVAVNQYPPESCDVNNPCEAGCLCISTDSESLCDCSERQCFTGSIVHYRLPMDVLLVDGQTLQNPSGLDAKAYGRPYITSGIINRALQLEGPNQYVQVAGPGHRFECFGDLDKCNAGHTMSFWVNFLYPLDSEEVYLTNGGHTTRCHGVAMTYDRGHVKFNFRKRSGDDWTAETSNVLPGRWYHVTTTWKEDEGLNLYIDGKHLDADFTPTTKSAGDVDTNRCQQFLLGRPNDGSSFNGNRTVLFDEFNFWSEYKTPAQVKELGPFYKYEIPMEDMARGKMFTPNPDYVVDVGGQPSLVLGGKVGKALQLNGRNQYLDGGNHAETCLGDLELCVYGITTAAWVQLSDLRDNSVIMDTGPRGLKVYYNGAGQLKAEAQSGNAKWQTTYDGGLEANKWYFIEATWNHNRGLELWVDLEQVASSSVAASSAPGSGESKLLIGRANSEGGRNSYANMMIDQFMVAYGDRARLLQFGVIARGRPTKQYFDMNTINGNRLAHLSMPVLLHGNPRVVRGKIAGGMNLNGNSQYANFGSQAQACMGNLDLCPHGVLWGAWFRSSDFANNMEIMSSGVNGINMRYVDGKVLTTASTTSRQWQVSTALQPNQWYFLEVGWHPVNGLSMYANNRLTAMTNGYTDRSREDLAITTRGQNNFYIGRGDGTQQGMRYGNFTIDDMEYWYGNRDYLLAFDYLQRGAPDHLVINMDQLRGGKIVHESLQLPVYGGASLVRGQVDHGLRLNGNSQYLDIGQHSDVCLGNLELCNHGITGSMWMNFASFDNNMYYYSNGDGMKIYYRNGNLYFVFQSEDKEWQVAFPYVPENTWQFIEYTWHPEKGLRVYLNNILQGHTQRVNPVSSPPTSDRNRVFLGRANPSDGGYFKFGDFSVDQFETWYSDRDYLIAWEYISRDDITHLMIPLEDAIGNKVVHPVLKDITLVNGAVLRPAKVGNGADLAGGGEYLTLGEFPNQCLGNLEHCPHGIMITFYVNPRELRGSLDTYFLSSQPYDVYYRDGKIMADFRTATREWTVSSDQLRVNEWSRVDLSWDEKLGLEMYIDGASVEATSVYRTHNKQPSSDNNVYVGRPHNTNSNGRYLNGMVDEMEVWYANRNHLENFGLIKTGTEHIILPMDEIQGRNLIYDGRRDIYVYNDPSIQPAIYDGGIYLNGNRQYVNVGRNVVCSGRLENCLRGLTLRYKINPKQLLDNTYFVSSAPMDVYYRDGRMHVVARTEDNVWEVNTQSLPANDWSQIDVSWDRTAGLQLYHNGILVDSQVTPSTNRETYDVTRNFYIGRHYTDMQDESYTNALIDDFQLWQANRDYLITHDLIFPGPGDKPQPQRTTRPPPTTTPRPDWPYIPEYTGGRKILVYNGNAWSTYDTSDFPADFLGLCGYEQFVVRFMTSEPTGLLWYTGRPDKNMHLGFKNGDVVLNVQYGTHTDRFRVSTGSPLNDNQWHQITVTRRLRTLTINVDGLEDRKQLTDDIVLRQREQVLLGGSSNPRRATDGEFNSNFEGSIEEALLRCDSNEDKDLNMNHLFVVRRRPEWVTGTNVRIVDYTQPTQPPSPSGVHFRRTEAYIRLPRLEMQDDGTIEGRFRTVDSQGVLLYNGPEQGRSDFILLEFYDGILYLVLDMGDGVVKRYAFGDFRLDDGLEHQFHIDRDGRRLKLTLDGIETEHILRSSDNELNLGTFLYVGGVDDPQQLPWHSWSRDGRMFVGCLSDLRINGAVSDLAKFGRDQAVRGIEDGCGELLRDCSTVPCLHGVCRETVSGYYCDCANTPYTGRDCQEAAANIVFDCSNHVMATMNPTSTTHTNDISLRFRTLQADGLLFKTSNQFTSDAIKVALENGRGRVDVNIAGQRQSLNFCNNLNDNKWHTFHLQRRADHIEVWADNCEKATVDLGGSRYSLDVDEIAIGGDGTREEKCFVGNLQNLYFDRRDLFTLLRLTGSDNDVPPYNPVTFRDYTYNHVTLPSLQMDGNMHVQLMIKTTDGKGLLLYSEGISGDFLALELTDGALQFIVDAGAQPRIFIISEARLNDDRWHNIEIVQEDAQKFLITVDDKLMRADLTSGSNTVDLDSYLFVGGVPADMYRDLPRQIFSRKGFVGCMATVRVMRTLYDVINDAEDITEFVTPGCGAYGAFCKENPCDHGGRCVEGLTTYHCDCNMTSFVGPLCRQESEGFELMQRGDRTRGIVMYDVIPNKNTHTDELAFGFMTYKPNGTLVRLDSGISADFIEAKLENGYVVVTYDIGDNLGPQRLVESSRIYSDGQYHYVTFKRHMGEGYLNVDVYDTVQHIPAGSSSSIRMFNDLSIIKIGGDKDLEGNIINYFDGIIAGVYYNGTRITDMTHGYGVVTQGGVTRALHPFRLEDPVTVIIPVVTARPIDPVDPVRPGAEYPPLDGNGGGVAWQPIMIGEGGDTPEVVGVAINSIPGGGGVGINDGGAGVAGIPPGVVGKQVGSPGAAGGVVEGGRAAGAAGALFGVLVLASALMWALYKFKPGLLGGGGGGGGTGESANLLISPPRQVNNFVVKGASSTYGPVKVDINGGTFLGSGDASVGTQTLQTMHSMDVAQFAEAGGVAGVYEFYYGGGSASRATQTNLTAYGASLFNRSMSTNAYDSWGAGAAKTSTLAKQSYNEHYNTTAFGHEYSSGGVVSVARAPRSTMEMGTMTVSNCGTQTDGDLGAFEQVDYSASRVTNTLQSSGSAFNAIQVEQPQSYNTMQSSSQTQTINNAPPRYNTMQGQGYSSQGQGYASQGQMHSQGQGAAYNTMQNTQNAFTYNSQDTRHTLYDTPYGDDSYHALHMNATNLFGSQMNAQSQAAGVMMASEEIRVDCAHLTQDGRYVVTGSIYGPPQVWDLRSGALVRIMEGEDFSTTDLHLAANDSLLVGQVAELTPMEGQDPNKSASLHHRKLQIWDFETGTPLIMAKSEQCTASALMSDGGRVVLGHTDKYGNGTNIVIWDLLGNELLRKIKYNASIGFADYISYLTLSRDNRYVIAGFQNSFDGHANFLVFDLTVENYDYVDPKILALDATAECSAVLDNHEMVTGSRSGELIIWSMRTGKPLRQLVSPAPLPIGGSLSVGRSAKPAHSREIKAVAISRDAKLLVSASCDHTLKVWNLETERLMFTLKGHTDEVWCCTVSTDDEMLVSGSRDGTIRLWRLQTGQHVCSFNTGYDIFSLKMSRDKRTIVALGDREGVRKLIMLRVVVTKVRSRAGSRATSPLSVGSEGYHPY